MATTPQDSQEAIPSKEAVKTPITSQRSLRQMGLCLAGIGSIVLSTAVTKRAVAKHNFAARMKTFQPSHTASYMRGSKREGAVLAAEAFQLATLNLASWALMGVGGMSWALDISSFAELKRYTRNYTRPNPDQTDEEAEAEMQAEVVELMSKYLSETQMETLLTKAIEEKKAASASASGTATSSDTAPDVGNAAAPASSPKASWWRQ